MIKIKYVALFLGIACIAVVLLLLKVANISLPPDMTNITITYNKQEDNHALLPIASNQWYSSVYKDFPTQPLFAMPLAFSVSSQGLSFSYPDVTKTQNTIFGSYNADFTVGSTETFQKPTITQIGDWDIRMNLPTYNNHAFSFFLAHGVPYTIIHSTTDNIVINFTQVPQVISTDKNTRYLTVKIKNHYYIFAASQNISWVLQGTTITLNHMPSLFVGLLDSPAHAQLFLDISQNDLIGTKATYEISGNQLKTTYLTKTSNGKTLIALYPHQYDNLVSKIPTLGTYTTIRGQLKLVALNSFTTSLPLLTPPITFSKLNSTPSTLKTQVNNDIDTYIAQGPPNSEDYYLGTWLGKGATLIQLADTLGQENSKNKLLNYLIPIFEKSLQNFAYQKSTTSFVALHPEFGNEVNNDHHFHYGYYIRTASVLASYNPAILPKVKPTINNMVLDIANTNKQSSQYPYLRNFDTYESHSWADGFASFADGNNQESSSEAMNAWYGIYLWGNVLHNQQLMNTGLYLYNQELLGTKYYWFDIKNMYTAPYLHAIGSIVWGGKIDFATWFSGLTNMKYGIQLLPFTPGSVYLGTLPEFTKYQNDYFKSGGNVSDSWGDLFLMWESFYQPSKALAEESLATDHEANVPQSLFLYQLLSNAKK